MTVTLDAQELASELERVQGRVDRITGAVSDAELQERLAVLREHLAVAATTLNSPTRSNLARVDQRVRYATRQLDLLTRWPRPTGKRGLDA